MSIEPVSALHGDPHEEAERLGLVCFPGKDRILQIDLDESDRSGPSWVKFREGLDFLRRLYIDQNRLFDHSLLVTRSKSLRYHVYLYLAEPHEAAHRISLQGHLGSDPTREALSLARLQFKTRRHPSVLFETAQEAPRVVAWEREWTRLVDLRRRPTTTIFTALDGLLQCNVPDRMSREATLYVDQILRNGLSRYLGAKHPDSLIKHGALRRASELMARLVEKQTLLPDEDGTWSLHLSPEEEAAWRLGQRVHIACSDGD